MMHIFLILHSVSSLGLVFNQPNTALSTLPVEMSVPNPTPSAGKGPGRALCGMTCGLYNIFKHSFLVLYVTSLSVTLFNTVLYSCRHLSLSFVFDLPLGFHPLSFCGFSSSSTFSFCSPASSNIPCHTGIVLS